MKPKHSKTMKTCKYAVLVILLIYFISNVKLKAQLYQTLRGKVTDEASKTPIVGAAVILLNTNPLKAMITDNEGKFKFIQVHTGRHNLKISVIGYETSILHELLVTTGKELVLNIELKESTVKLDEVVISARSKDKPLNSMSTISARAFTVEETQRYAGGFDDPGRLVSAFAGVSDGNVESNGIIVRGNSPIGAIYRIEGVEVMNPNHFAGEDLLGGGFVSIISNNVLSNSDFLTGAFPAEYGNALSAVFDMNLKTGNTEKNERTFQAGVLGLDFASEGPFVKNGKSSYIVNYRYSTFGLVQFFLPPGEGLPVYQDLCFNLVFPGKAGTFSIWGVGGTDGYTFKKLIDDKYQTAVLGIKHKIILDNNLYINSSFVYNTFIKKNRWFDKYNFQYYPISRINNFEECYTFSSNVNKKYSSKHSNRTGINIKKMVYSFDNNYSEKLPDPLAMINHGKGNCSLIQAYTQSKFSISDKTILNAGFNYQSLTLNKRTSFEPRFGVKINIMPKHYISIACGMHSQMQLMSIYFINQTVNDVNSNPNKNLDFTRAAHLILGYDWNMNENVRLKIEPYYQFLYNVPVIPDSSFSLLNLDVGNEFHDALVNKGKGENIGIDFTFERFLNNGYYYLVTASVFNSRYRGDDNIWRNTRFNKNFITNILGGKEWEFEGTGKNRIFGINGRLYFKGGDRINPINPILSEQNEKVVFDETNAFEKKASATYRFDFSMSYRTNRPTYSTVWSVQIMNLFYTSILSEFRFDKNKKKVTCTDQRFIMPSLSWRIDF